MAAPRGGLQEILSAEGLDASKAVVSSMFLFSYIWSIGAPLIECYGAAYQIQEHAIQWTIASDARCKARDADRFAKAVLQALTDVYKLIEEGAPEIGASAMRARSRL